ncbi:MAG TPA: DUF2961 domain-containing protein [Lacipirellulaceae bacterium]|nr:DUF2961 domain-containing protein [Lacipirellulaceae bacterium]
MSRPDYRYLFAVICVVLVAHTFSSVAVAQGIRSPSADPPKIPIGADAFTRWDHWPYLRVGVRCYMRSTFDRSGGNDNADAAHFIRQVDDTHNVALDELGPGILWFARYNHWHGSPWQFLVDGKETVVTETSTRDPVHPAKDSIFEPAKLFPAGLNYTWAQTKGADLSWSSIPFEHDLQIAYGHAHYGTGYFILWKMLPGMDWLSRPLESWHNSNSIPNEVVDLVARSGTDIAPRLGDIDEEQGSASLAATKAKQIWHSAAGPSMIRRIAFRVPDKFADAFAAARLRIFWDDRTEPSVDAPLGLFFGAGSLLRDPDQEYIVKSFPMTIRHENSHYLFATYFPMPFHRTARIELIETAGKPITGIEWEVRHAPYTDPPNWVGLFHATYRDFPHPERGRDLELLDTRKMEGGGDWCGHIVGTTYTFTRTGELRTLEGDPRFYLDDSLTPQGQGTGSEEWGGGGDYWGGERMTLPFAGHPVGRPIGKMKTDVDKIHSAYRFLLSDLIPFGKNARFTLEHGGTNDSDEHYETVTYWYGLQSAALQMTDEFDVGNPASEKDHDYKSPDVSPPESLASRHEVGVDHIPSNDGSKTEIELVPTLTDDGRLTKTQSEFTIRIRPDALGVMLRRRLDLAYPNQKAIIYVADASSKTPDWQEAGSWYTAGGNTVVFGDPRIVPESKRPQSVELMPPVHIPQTSNRRWRDDEFLLPPRLTRGHDKIRVRCEFMPVDLPLMPGQPPQPSAWSEFHYWAYSFTMPQTGVP